MSRTGRMRGFTLVEMMVAGALLAVIISASMGAFMSTNIATNQTYLTANLQENARLSLDALAADLRAAGLGASNGTVGIAPGGAWAARVPTIYTSAPATYLDPSGNSFTLRSVYIVGAEPGSVGFTGAGDGIEGVITDPATAKIRCSNAGNTTVDCSASAIGSDLLEHALLVSTGANVYQPLLFHDHQRAAIISPTGITGSPGSQLIAYSESGGTVSPSPDPAAPFGFAQGFQVARARVVHWYLKQSPATAQPRLYRSRPTMTTSATAVCANPFVDETVDPVNGVKGIEMGAGPVESLQLRFVFDPAEQDDPTQYSMTDTIDPCNPPLMRQLREVRIQMVAISPSPAKDTNGGLVLRFKTPAFEGTGAGTTSDQYPRRSYVTRVAPRNFQPYRL